MILIIEERERENLPLLNVGMLPLSASGSVMRGDLNNRREKQKEIKGKPLICGYDSITYARINYEWRS